MKTKQGNEVCSKLGRLRPSSLSSSRAMSKYFKKPLLMLIGLLICLGMLRLGVLQLDRADEKQTLLDQVLERAQQPAVNLSSIATELNSADTQSSRFKRVMATGRYAPNHSIYIDNRVLNSNVGYAVLTPLKIDNSPWWIMVDRGWLSAGLSREKRPDFITSPKMQQLIGRLNLLPQKPPLWDEDYPVANGALWQYFSIAEYSAQTQLQILPLVLELAPESTSEVDPNLIRSWAKIDDQWVARHHAYAVQWFAMAAAFLIACIVLIIRTNTK